MGLFDRSSSTNNTNLVDQTTTVTDQVDQSGGLLTFSDVAGAVGLDLSSRQSDSHDIYDSRSSSSSIANSGNTVLSDSGAIAAGLELGASSIKSLFDSLASFAGLSKDSLSTVAKVNSDSLSLLGALANKSIDASNTLARDSADTNSNFLQSALTGFGSLAKQTSEGSDDKMTRVIGFALAAVVAMVVLPSLFKGGGKGVIV